MTDEQDLIETPEVEEEVIEQPEEGADVGEGAPDDMGLVVEIGGDDEDEEAPAWVNQLRRENRELKKWRKEQEAKAAMPAEARTLPPEPQFEDFDYEPEAFKAAHKEWVKKSLEVEQEQKEFEALQERAQQRWEAKLSTYEEGKAKLGAPDFEDVEAAVSEIFAKPFPGMNMPDVRMGIIKQGAKDPTTLVYALGRNPETAKTLAAIDDPVEFAFALGELSGKMKVVHKKAPPPEGKVKAGAAGVAGALDNTLERLREKAEKTGDYTEVTRYKRQLAAK
jgi:hypothetical protein